MIGKCNVWDIFVEQQLEVIIVYRIAIHFILVKGRKI
jgi:hypothetical protein